MKRSGVNVQSARAPKRPVASETTSVRLDKAYADYLKWQDLWGYSKATQRDYRVNVGAFVQFHAQTRSDALLREIKASDFEAYLLSVHQREVSRRYLRSIYQHVKTFFNWCVRTERIEVNPLAKYPPPKVPKTRKRAPSIDMVKEILALPYCSEKHMPGLRRRAMIHMLVDCGGARVSELAAMKVSDVADAEWFPLKTIRIGLGKGQRERRAPFTRAARQAMALYLEKRKAPDSPDKWRASPYLWITEWGEQFKASGISLDFDRLFRHAGLRDQIKDRTHAFRRTFAVESIRAGKGRLATAAAGGWLDLNTLDNYTAGELDDEAAMLAAFEDHNPLR